MCYLQRYIRQKQRERRMEAQRRQEEQERERRERQERQRELMQRQRRIVQANLRARHRGRVERVHNGVLTDTFLVSNCFSAPVYEGRYTYRYMYHMLHLSSLGIWSSTSHSLLPLLHHSSSSPLSSSLLLSPPLTLPISTQRHLCQLSLILSPLHPSLQPLSLASYLHYLFKPTTALTQSTST